MLKRFNLSAAAGGAAPPVQLRLKAGCGVLALLNAIALFFYVVPPGGTREELAQQSVQLRNRIAAARSQGAVLKATSAKVQSGSGQVSDFETTYFLHERRAYEAVIVEIQQLAKTSGMQERDRVYSEEPIEGTANLLLMNITANFTGSYGNLMHFLYEVDRSPMLLMLDSLNATPQPKGGDINATIRFQAIVVEDPSAPAAPRGQP